MKIGLIIYSHTGNTKAVAREIADKLTAEGHEARIDEITISGTTPAQAGKFELTSIPAVEHFEALIFGAPVQAFALHPVMKTYLQQLPAMQGKKVVVFVTKHLPLLWLGGTGAVATMRKACEEKGAKVLGSEIVVWAEKRRHESMQKCVQNIGRIFSAS